MDIKILFENSTPEQRQRAFQCKTEEELKLFAKDENIDISAEDVSELFISIQKNSGNISDDDLDNIAGGKSWRNGPKCGSTDYELTGNTHSD